MANLKSGDRVKISSREVTAQDAKTGLFFNHFRGLTGTVQKVYKSGEVAVEVEMEALPRDIWKRHMETRDQMRQKWLDSLADDVRRKLTPEQKTFELRYVALVAAQDLEKRRAERARLTT
jgi:siderophore synthetase component